MTTVHATTATQKTVDGPSHSKLPFTILKDANSLLITLQRTGEAVEVLLLTLSLLLPVLLRWVVHIIAVC